MTCPICSRPASPGYRPFCSRRCADVDLGRWLTGGYAIPGPETGPDAEDDGPPEAAEERPFRRPGRAH